MISHKIYLDYSAGKDVNGYFEVEVLSIDPFTEQAIDEMVVTRKSWGDVKIKNTPFDGVMLYDAIQAKLPTEEIRIKLVSSYETIVGYFGSVDCKVDDDHKVLTIRPTLLDQYTPFLEGMDNDVRLFDVSNVVKNGKFKEISGTDILNWTLNSESVGNLKLERKYTLSKTAVGISDDIYVPETTHYNGGWNATTNTPALTDGTGVAGDYYISSLAGTYNGMYYAVGEAIIYNGSKWVPYWTENWIPPEPCRIFPTVSMAFYQTIDNILKDKQLTFSFNYALTGTTERLKNLSFDILLLDSASADVYRLLKNGSWTKELVGTNHYYYKNNKIAIPYESLDKYTSFSEVTQKTPVSGQLQIIFYRPEDNQEWDKNYELILTDVELGAAEIELKTISINLASDYLVTVPQISDKIFWSTKVTSDGYFYKRSPNWKVQPSQEGEDKYHPITDFFVDGVPNMAEFDSSENGMRSNEGRGSGLTYKNLIDIFSNKLHPSYKFELSKVTVYQGEYSTPNHRRWYATAEFSREERYTYDTQTDSVWTPVIPEEGVGWEDTGIVNSNHYRLWVRTPFNNSVVSWTLGTIVEHTTAVRHDSFAFYYYKSLTSTKNYPILSSQSQTIETAIDLRELIRKVYCGSDESLIGKNVYSTFFWNDRQTTEIENAIGFKLGINYVTNAANELNKIAAIHTNDLSTEPSTDEEKSVLKISGKKLIDDLKVLFPQLYWYVDADYNLHIEHVKFFDLINNVKSLLGVQYSYIKNYKQWDFLKEKMFSLEEYTIKNSGYNDFKTATVTFDKIVSNKRGSDIKASYSTDNLSTDIQYCVENQNSLDNGIILVCYETIDGENIAKYGNGQKTNKVVVNGDLSISTLLKKYARYEGTYLTGKINDEQCTFEYTKRVRQGSEIQIKGIFSDKLILNNIGRGLLRTATIDYKNENTKAVFIYRYASSDLSNGINATTGEQSVVDVGGGDFIVRTAPTVLTNPLGSISEIDDYFYVFANGTVLTDGDSPIEERGVCYSLSSNPTILDTTSVAEGFIGSFVRKLKIYVEGTYHLRAYATNTIGLTSYGEEITFTLTFTVA